MLEQVHLIFQEFCAVQRRQKILFHFGEFFPGNRISRDQNEFHGLRQFILMLPETFPQQTPGAITFNRAADFFARHDSQFRFCAVRQPLPVGDKAAEREPLPLPPDARKITALPDARGAAQAFRNCGGRGHAKSNRRQALATKPAAVAQDGLAAFARIAVEKSMLPFAADLGRLILAFHKFNWLRVGA